MTQTKTERYADALMKIGWLANKHKMGTPQSQQMWKDTLEPEDLWAMIEKIGKIAATAIHDEPEDKKLQS